MASKLRARGAESLAYPCVALAPPADPGPLEAGLAELVTGKFDWLALTSANAAHALDPAWHGLPARQPITGETPVPRVAVVGPATAAALREVLGLAADIVADDDAQALAAAVPLKPGDRVLLPQSGLANRSLADALASRGAIVAAVEAYTMAVGSGGVDLPTLLAAGKVDAITLASGSAAANLLVRLRREGVADPAASLADVPIACLGRSAVDKLPPGLRHVVTAATPTLDALLDAVESAARR